MNHAAPAVIFRDELPVPTTNITIYEQLYVLEQWFRRVALAGLMAPYGSTWKSALPSELMGDLKRRLKQLEGRVHLDCENSDNVIWLLTLDELRQVLLTDSTWPSVKRLTGLSRGLLESKLDELREIRNVVSHNRATTENTLVILNGLNASLRSGIAQFKDEFLYPTNGAWKQDPDTDSVEGLVPSLFAELEDGNDWSSFQPMLSESTLYFSLTSLPTEPFAYLNVNRFLEKMKDCERGILALLLNKTGAEFTLTWPKAVTDPEHDQIVRFFFSCRHPHWTDTEYHNQRVSAICNPRVWFYENARPEDA